MKLIRIARLIRRQAVTYHCEIELCQLPGQIDENDDQTPAFMVNVRQGKAGEEWRETARTPQAVSLITATALFDQLVASRRQQGFVDSEQEFAQFSGQSAQTAVVSEAEAVLLARLQQPVWRTLSENQRSRTVWRIGERRLTGAVPSLVPLLESGNGMLDYCLAWAIGRGGDSGAAEAMQVLHTRAGDAKVKRIALHAWLQLASDTECAQYAQALVGDWPAGIRHAWDAQNPMAIADASTNADTWRSFMQTDWLEQLDHVALSQPFARGILLQQMKTVPLQGGTFRAVRHIYKAAEFRDDAELFGILHHRFEITAPTVPGYGGYVRAQSKWVPYRREVVSPTSTVAYNGVTREYFRRRGWRTLRRLGEDQDPRFVTMAVGALQALDDSTAGSDYKRTTTLWERKTRTYHTQTLNYGPYSHWMLFNRLLHANSTQWVGNRTGRSWYFTAQEERAATSLPARAEAYPALWDKQPDALLYLLLHSGCAGVHRFAARALEDNVDYCKAISIETLHRLLTCTHVETLRFAFRLCCKRYPVEEMPGQWLLLFLQSALPEARQYVLDCISRNPAYYSTDTTLVTAMLYSMDDTVRKQGRIMCQLAITQAGQAEGIVGQLLAWLEDASELGAPHKELDAIMQNLLWTLQNPLRQAAARVSYARLLALLDASLLPVRLLAADWLLQHEQPTLAIPGATLRRLLEDADPNARSIGIKLFGALPDAVLVQQVDLFAVFCTHENQHIRRAIDPALRRIGPAFPEFCAALLPHLLDCLFRSEPAEGVHADIQQWLLGPMQAVVATMDRDTVVRLLQARSKGAQLLGANLLYRFAATDFSVREWATLGRNEDVSVRDWVKQNYRDHVELIRAQLEDALGLLHSRWDDVRTFACIFFRDNFEQRDWTPTLLVNLCDHIDPAVQRFGREMLATHFDLEHITEYMLKLSQHPSLNMQLFVSNWLENSAAGKIDALTRLEPYFLSVLSQVNRGRIVKNRILTFLQQQVEHSEDVAALVVRIFARQVVTVAITDKAQYIDGLRVIGQRYPALESPLTIVAPRTLPIKNTAVANAADAGAQA